MSSFLSLPIHHKLKSLKKESEQKKDKKSSTCVVLCSAEDPRIQKEPSLSTTREWRTVESIQKELTDKTDFKLFLTVASEEKNHSRSS